jgi:hypothetical protein
VAGLGLAVLLGLALLLGPAPGAQAASVTDLYLLSTFSTSASPSGSPPGITAPFTLTGTGGVELGLNASAVETSQTVSESSDAALNIDFGSHAKVILKIPTGGFNSLMIAEDAGLDPFKLERCADAACVVRLNAVPEPTTFLLWGTTAAGLALARWRRRYRAAQ